MEPVSEAALNLSSTPVVIQFLRPLHKTDRFSPRETSTRGASMRVGLLCAFALLLTASTALAQFDTATVVGTVRDTSGAVVPAAKVTLTSAGTGISVVKTSSADGNYEFPAVRPGSYLVTAEKSGLRARDGRQRPGPGRRAAARRSADAGRAGHREGRGHGDVAAARNRFQPARPGDQRRSDARAAAASRASTRRWRC